MTGIVWNTYSNEKFTAGLAANGNYYYSMKNEFDNDIELSPKDIAKLMACIKYKKTFTMSRRSSDRFCENMNLSVFLNEKYFEVVKEKTYAPFEFTNDLLSIYSGIKTKSPVKSKVAFKIPLKIFLKATKSIQDFIKKLS